MKKIVMLAGLFMAAQGTFAQVPTQGNDIWRTERIDSITVTSTRVSATTPMVYTNMDKREIARTNYGQDIPFLLQLSPSVVVTSDAGAGVGYTSIRVRGTDATRINVTANGIPLNDAESHSLFWVNTPDLVSSVGSVQIQRGVGTSTNGAGAFGASINMLTEPISNKAYGEVSGTYGSYNTHKETIKFGTGLLGGRWAFDVRLSNIHSDGYRDRASTDMKSYFAQGAYYAKNTVLRFVTYGGKEETYHAWTAVDKWQIEEHGRRYNPCGEMEHYVLNPDGSPVLEKDKPKMEFAGWYDDQTDSYVQSNYQLHLNHQFCDRWSLGAAVHYTKGDGYYEEYKNDRTLKEYGLKPYSYKYETTGGMLRDTTVKKSNLVRRKEMDNHFGGGVFSVDYKSDRLRMSFGGAANVYDGDHFGRVMWVQNYHGDPGFRPGHKYYDNNGTKKDANIYAKANWEVARGVHLFGDVQYRHIGYKIKGANDNWDWNEEEMQRLDVDESFDFFNPKGGVFWKINDRWDIYGSVAVAHREPARNNYTDAKKDLETGKYDQPLAERLTDFEFGGNYRSRVFSAGVNFYYMKYKDQLILTGEVNHIGEPLADNVADSYRAGVEVSAGVQIAPWLRWDVNATLSRNRIKDYTEYLDDYTVNEYGDWEALYTQTVNKVGDTDISFSPSVTAGSLLAAQFRNFSVSLQTNYVGKQYVTNSKIDALTLDEYCVSNLHLAYRFRVPSLESVTLGVAVNNIFNAKYSSNGYGGSSMVDGKREESMYYFPQATANVLANIVIRF